MDYLDPKKKKAHKRRITIGYVLFSIVILFGTTLLVYIANGYDIDRDTGEFIQNGLIFVDSKPTNADVYLNGVKQDGQTDARLVVPADNYDIGIFKPGYRNWTRQLTLDGGSLRRITYPKLIPDNIEASVAVTLRSDPVHASQSINNRYLLFTHASEPLSATIVDVAQAAPVAEQLVIPSDVIDPDTDPAELTGTLEVIEWAANNRHMLVTYTSGDTVEYLLVDIEAPDEAVNLSTLFNRPGSIIELQDRRIDRFYVYEPDSQSLFTATDTAINLQPTLTKVVDYENFGSDWTVYIAEPVISANETVQVRFKHSDKDILLQEIPRQASYLLELARLGNAPIIAVGSPEQDRTVVFNDPENFLSNNETATRPVATAVLRNVNLRQVSISSDASVVIALGSDSFASYEFEADRSYRTTHGDTVVDEAQEIRWADGQHYIFASNGSQVISDFDGSNRFALLSSAPSFGSYFSSDIETLYTLSLQESDDSGDVTTPTRLNTASLLIPADR